MKYSKTQYMARLAILLAIVIAFTVFNIGNIPVGPIVATIYHVPVIIGAVLLGTKAGCILGGAWGLLCFLLAVTGQTSDVIALAAVANVPLSYFIDAFVPRLLVGLVSGLLFKALCAINEKRGTVWAGVAGVVGSLVNTVGYLGIMVLLLSRIVADTYGVSTSAVPGIALGVAATNGLAEAAVSAIITAAVYKAVTAFDKNKTKE